MRISRLQLMNWKNFRDVQVDLPTRVFLVGPNASGKSNFLDAVRFLHDIADPEGGLEKAVNKRGGVSQVRAFAARKPPIVSIAVEIGTSDDPHSWRYQLGFKGDRNNRPLITTEQVLKNGSIILTRPDDKDREDEERLRQTALEQVSANQTFRLISEFLRTVKYFHLVPQLVRDPDRSVPVYDDPFGADFLAQMARVPDKTRSRRIIKIQEFLRICLPLLKEIHFDKDPTTGRPHLKARFEQWRHFAIEQTEEHLSDGTLRIIGFLWSVLDGDGPLLLEEPELSLHSEIVKRIPEVIHRLIVRRGRQVLVSTHSPDMFESKGISPPEVLLLSPKPEFTEVKTGAAFPEIVEVVKQGVPLRDILPARTAPANIAQLALFDN